MKEYLGNMDPEKYYDEFGISEWERLEKNLNHKLEFENTVAYLKKFLPQKGQILDAGGGAGRYSIWLAKQGYEVTLIDISKKQVEIARNKAKEFEVDEKINFQKGDIRNLDFGSSTFDAVLCTGAPLSHIIEATERKKAVKELKRTSKPNAPIFISVIGLLATVLAVIKNFPHEIQLLPEIMEDGNYTKELLEKYDLDSTFTASHAFRREEFKELLEEQGLEVEKMAGLETFMVNSKTVSEENKKTIKKICKDYREDPTMTDISNHILAVARAK